MRILFLDDDNYRHELFKKRYPQAVSVYTAEECITRLQDEESWFIVCLDHDLGGLHYVNSDLPNTGMAVVRWIEENKPNVNMFACHSFNTPARVEMRDRLSKHYDIVLAFPFNMETYIGMLGIGSSLA